MLSPSISVQQPPRKYFWNQRKVISTPTRLRHIFGPPYRRLIGTVHCSWVRYERVENMAMN